MAVGGTVAMAAAESVSEVHGPPSSSLQCSEPVIVVWRPETLHSCQSE